ncbi:hypothetical protein [uncultured Parasphingorhabdus sp.]|uniref:hypothetical protein n=1 Tax=uncultured Parasphingorhabdus sp. TaxID=2709694 RepID=UPI0030DAF29C|tara:strand:- start:90744 stop:90992 length:249 start_codon:yes stop_codon:yes gene_type:complete
MRIRALLTASALLLSACAETPVEEKGDDAIAEMEKQIEQDAQSLEEAADEAVKAMAEDIDAELAADGIAGPATAPKAEVTKN